MFEHHITPFDPMSQAPTDIGTIFSSLYESILYRRRLFTACHPFYNFIANIVQATLNGAVCPGSHWVFTKEDKPDQVFVGSYCMEINKAVSWQRAGCVMFRFQQGFASIAEHPYFMNGIEGGEKDFFKMFAKAFDMQPFMVYIYYSLNGRSACYSSDISIDLLDSPYVFCYDGKITSRMTGNQNVADFAPLQIKSRDYTALGGEPVVLINKEHTTGEFLMFQYRKRDSRMEYARVSSDTLESFQGEDGSYSTESLEVMEAMGIKDQLWVDNLLGNELELLRPMLKWDEETKMKYEGDF